MIIQFSSKDGQTRIGNVDIDSCKTEHIFLKFISQIMIEKFHVTTIWKSTFINNKNYLQLNLQFDINCVSHDVITPRSNNNNSNFEQS
jgi:hypothetical protein